MLPVVIKIPSLCQGHICVWALTLPKYTNLRADTWVRPWKIWNVISRDTTGEGDIFSNLVKYFLPLIFPLAAGEIRKINRSAPGSHGFLGQWGYHTPGHRIIDIQGGL